MIVSTIARQSRRRGRELLEVIRQATRADLATVGYAGVTFDGVARRAQVSKPVLYRRYRSRAHMIADALVSQLEGAAITASTGSLRDDLRQVFQAFLQPARQVGPENLRALLGDADNYLLDELNDLAFTPAMASLNLAIDAARERGELGAQPVPGLVVLAPAWVLQSELLRGGVDTAFIDQVVDSIALPLYRAAAGDVQGQ